MNFYQARVRLVQAGVVLVAAALVAGCGNNYRPVITPVNPSGPASQVESLVAVVSAPSATAAGVATILDYSGDTILAEATIGPGPTAFTVDETGSNGYTINSNGTITNFPVSSTLQQKNVYYTTLPSTAEPLNLFSPSSGLRAADLYENVVDVFTGSPETFLLSVPVAATPVMVVGPGTSGTRFFAVSQNIASPTGVECNASPTTVSLNGVASVIESNYTVSAKLVLDPYNTTNDSSGTKNALCPVYAVESSDNQRVFILNRGSDTITVLNAPDGTLDSCTPFYNQAGQLVTCHPLLPLSTSAGLAQDASGDVPKTAGPVYAEYNATQSLLIVADYDGNAVSVIDVSLDEYGNDGPNFGTTYTIPVGKNPASVTALVDGSRAYTANQTDQTVTVVNLSSHTVEKTLSVTGHPRTVVSTQNSEYGKVYVASPDSNILTIISTGGTDPDIIDTTVALEGKTVDVRVKTQNGSSGNSNDVSRIPGYGQPCNLPDTASTASLAACQALP